jgi:hypothetical protein
MHIPNDGTKAPEQADYAPLPDNTRVLATIVPTRKNGTAIEKRAFANSGPNANITALGVRFRIADGQKGAGRNVFGTIPLARKFASGKPTHTFFGFFRALGYDVDAPDGIQFEDRDLFGKSIELVLGIEDDQDGKPQNIVKFYNAPSGPVTSSSDRTYTPPVADDVWSGSQDSTPGEDVWGSNAPTSDPVLAAAASSAVGF